MQIIDDIWGGWFSGLVDGEGHFGISKRKRGKNRNPCGIYRCQFTIHLRDDDKPILEEIHEMLNIGKIYDKSVPNNATPNTQTQTDFSVCSIYECAELVKIFSKYLWHLEESCKRAPKAS